MADDPQAHLKLEIINKAQAVLAAGEAALSGNVSPILPSFGAAELDAIERDLAGDPEELSFAELASAAEVILSVLSRPRS